MVMMSLHSFVELWPFFQVETKLLQCSSKAQGFTRLQHWSGGHKNLSWKKLFFLLLVVGFAILSSNYRIGFSKTGYHDDHHCWIFALMDPLFLTRFEFLFFFSMTKIADKVRLLKAPWFKRIFHEEEFDRIKIWCSRRHFSRNMRFYFLLIMRLLLHNTKWYHCL